MEAKGKTSFTPGPWVAERGVGWFVARPKAKRHPAECAIMVGMNASHSIVDCPSPNSNESECEANARLIAAAPELYESCRQLLAFAKSVRPGGGLLAGEAAMFADAESAIAKADSSSTPAGGRDE